jgi:hypothetical protein
MFVLQDALGERAKISLLASNSSGMRQKPGSQHYGERTP